MSEKYVTILGTLYQQTSGMVGMYGQLFLSFVICSGVRQRCPLLLNFAMDDLLHKTFDGVAICGVELLPGPRVADLVADGVALLIDDLNHWVTMYGVHFAPSKC